MLFLFQKGISVLCGISEFLSFLLASSWRTALVWEQLCWDKTQLHCTAEGSKESQHSTVLLCSFRQAFDRRMFKNNCISPTLSLNIQRKSHRRTDNVTIIMRLKNSTVAWTHISLGFIYMCSSCLFLHHRKIITWLVRREGKSVHLWAASSASMNSSSSSHYACNCCIIIYLFIDLM